MPRGGGCGTGKTSKVGTIRRSRPVDRSESYSSKRRKHTSGSSLHDGGDG